MNREQPEFKNIDEYISLQPENNRELLQQLRALIHKAAPGLEEVISYQMPAFKQNSVLVYFAGYKGHIGFYPTASGIIAFKDEFRSYKWSKGAVQFPVGEPLPAKLITRMVKFRAREDKEKAMLRSKKK